MKNIIVSDIIYKTLFYTKNKEMVAIFVINLKCLKKEMVFFSFILDIQNAQDLTNFVNGLFEQMNSRFQEMSSSIVNRYKLFNLYQNR